MRSMKYTKISPPSSKRILPLAAVFGIIGVLTLLASSAATGPSLGLEAESGNLSGDAITKNSSSDEFVTLHTNVSPSPTPSPTPTPIAQTPFGLSGNFELTFADEFDAYSTTNWTRTYPWDESGNERRATDGGTYQIIDPANVTVENGILKLLFKKLAQPETIDGLTRQWTTGMIHSRNKITIDGSPAGTYIEIKSKPAAGNGLWSHAWFLPEDFARDPNCPVQRYTLKLHSFNGKYPDLSEYNVRGRLSCQISANALSDESFIHQGVNHTQEFHVYGMDWYPDRIDFYFDGQKVHTSTALSGNSSPGFLILNGYVTADGLNGRTYYPYDSAPDATTPTQTSFDIDYVKVWKRQ